MDAFEKYVTSKMVDGTLEISRAELVELLTEFTETVLIASEYAYEKFGKDFPRKEVVKVIAQTVEENL